MGFECTSFFSNLAIVGEREDLESAAVGQYRPFPAHEAMQTASSLQDVDTGTQVEMIGVSQYDFCIDVVAQFVLMDGLDAAHSADGHEYWRWYITVVSMEYSGTGVGQSVCFLKVKMHVNVCSMLKKCF